MTASGTIGTQFWVRSRNLLSFSPFAILLFAPTREKPLCEKRLIWWLQWRLVLVLLVPGFVSEFGFSVYYIFKKWLNRVSVFGGIVWNWVQLSSVQDNIYALRNAHTRPTLSLSLSEVSPALPFKTVPMSVLFDDGPLCRPLMEDHLALPLSIPLSSTGRDGSKRQVYVQQ